MTVARYTLPNKCSSTTSERAIILPSSYALRSSSIVLIFVVVCRAREPCCGLMITGLRNSAKARSAFLSEVTFFARGELMRALFNFSESKNLSSIHS